MKIVYSGIQHNYYDLRKGLTFEYQNFYSSLKNFPGVELVEYPCDLIVKIGKKAWNEGLLELVKKEKPDLFFAFMYSEEFDKKVLDEVKKITTSVGWFADDHWRLYNYSRSYAPHFTWVVTTWSKAPNEYARCGIRNVIRSQWACNASAWKPVAVPKDIDVSFVGQKNRSRERLVHLLNRAGFNVYVRGFGWPGGVLPKDEMLSVFSRSKINLNLNNPIPLFAKKSIGRLFFKPDMNRYVPDWYLVSNVRTWFHMRTPQIKARLFELAGCGAFVVSGYADDLGRYYRENEEMVFYRSPRELVEKVRYYLSREDERARIAHAAYERTIRDHTYEKRFQELFQKIFST
ncbi:MAG: glycosyltransferase [Parcubacteria group bacterium]|nr:glycosyltransferase [Parcubacteria group bacterium]